MTRTPTIPTVPTVTPVTVPVTTPDQTARFSEADWTRVATLVSHGVPRSHALAVVQSQRDARIATRPSTRVVSVERAHVRQTAGDRIDPATGLPVIRPVADHAHRPYRVVGTTAIDQRALTTRDDGRPSVLASARAALGG